MDREFAVLDVEDEPRWSGHESLWIDPLARPGERWRSYRVWAGQLPDDPGALAGVVVTGSHHSVVQGAPWLAALSSFVQRAVAAESGPVVVGCCFGHQAVAAALGGRVGLNPDGRFAFGAHSVQLSTELGGRALRLLESHEEQVLEPPPGARILATAPGSRHEALALGRRVLSFQGHPEMRPEHLIERILPGLRQRGRLSPAEETAALRSLEGPLDSADMLDIVRRFLDRGAGDGAHPVLTEPVSGER